MRLRYVSDEELNQVIKLKQAGASWLKIQENSGIPRRTAKRAYEEWERTKSRDELKRARVEVATQEFGNHLDDLTVLAESLADYLYTPQPMDEIGSADRLLEELWKRDIRKAARPYLEARPYLGEREGRRNVRQNRMLFRSLQDHTREQVRWQALEEWKEALNSYIGHGAVLRAKAREEIDNILQKGVELKGRIEAASGGKDIVENMAMGVVEALWRAILVGKPYQERVFIGTRSLGERGTEVGFGKEASRIALLFSDEKLAEEVATVCKWAASALCQEKNVLLLEEMGNEISKMEQGARELEGMLDRLVLRPMILRTRCELCPA